MPPKKYVALALVPALVLLTACALPDFDFVSYPPWTTVYGAARDERNVADMLYDKAVSTHIKAALMGKNGELGLKVKVYCFLRRVTLLGQVGDDDFKAFALATAWEAEGVRGVDSAWVDPGRAGTAAADVEIAARLRAALVGDEEISATQIEAEVFGGQVYLMGMVRGQQDADRAVAHARALPGVSGVTSLLIPTQQDQTDPRGAEMR